MTSGSVVTTEGAGMPEPPTSLIHNVLLFGETGVGKSSIINMLLSTDDTAAPVSSGALGCTFQSTPHLISINGMKLKVWDTAGLNEGEQGQVPGEKALENLKDLVNQLCGEGIALLLFCVRGPRIRDIWRINYDTFCETICLGKVAIAICITGLENEDPMDSWWEKNVDELSNRGMTFADHACITASQGKLTKDGTRVYENEYEESKGVVKKLIEKNCKGMPWRMDKVDWLEKVEAKIVRKGDSSSRPVGSSHESRQERPTSTCRFRAILEMCGRLRDLYESACNDDLPDLEEERRPRRQGYQSIG